MRGLRKLIAAKRLCYLKREASFKFAGVVHNCCNVSANNHALAFVIRRSVLGYPMLEQIDRPQEVQLSEYDNCVIIKDGYVYELTKRVE